MTRCGFPIVVAVIALLGCDKEEEAAKPPVNTSSVAESPTHPAEAPPDAQTEKSAQPFVTATKIETENFSAPIPAGYTLASAERAAQLGQQFGQKVEALLTRGSSSKSLRESIFITQLPSKEMDPTNMSQCRRSAKAMMRVTGATLAQKAAIVEYPFGKTCQFALGGGKTHTIQSFAYVGDMLWTVTCKTTTQRRKAGTSECGEVLAGFTE
jgi:hypothetical protein